MANNSSLIRLSKSCISNTEIESVTNVLKNEFLGMGSEVKLFEERLSSFFSGRKVVCVNTGTSALHLALQAISIKSGDEIIVPSLTYVATYQAITAAGGRPISCDINLKTLNLDLDDVKRKITRRTKAIIFVHYSGDSEGIQELYELSNELDLRVIEDAAHAFGSIYKGNVVGSFGDIVCFSFDGIKNLTCGEGGCIVSSDEILIEKVKDLRLLGVKNDSQSRYEGKRTWSFDVTEQGWRYHMSNIMAAIGNAQLTRFNELASKRKSLAFHYDSLLKKSEVVQVFDRNYELIVPHIYVILLPIKIDRNEFIKNLESKNIQTGIHYQPNHNLTYFCSRLKLPNIESIEKRLISLPLHPDLSVTDIDYICENVLKYAHD
jgi:dTDP-4-amino-4,6-dideoxygalactose transaminase